METNKDVLTDINNILATKSGQPTEDNFQYNIDVLRSIRDLLADMDIGGGGGSSTISLSDLLTLSVAGWDATTKQQTVSIPLDTSKRNVIDITIGENEAWDNFGVYPVSETSTGIVFEAVEIPDQALTFKVCSMEVS